MRVLSASLGSYIIDATGVIFIQESARDSCNHQFSIDIFEQVFPDKCLWWDRKMFGYALCIRSCDQCWCSLTTVGTFQTVYFLKYLIMKISSYFIRMCILWDASEILFVRFEVFFGVFFPVLYDFVHVIYLVRATFLVSIEFPLFIVTMYTPLSQLSVDILLSLSFDFFW